VDGGGPALRRAVNPLKLNSSSSPIDSPKCSRKFVSLTPTAEIGLKGRLPVNMDCFRTVGYLRTRCCKGIQHRVFRLFLKP
jgi:hypothetical protein